MKTQTTLELSDVQAIAAAAQAEAQKNKWAVSIAIVDAGGHLLHFQRLDGAAPSLPTLPLPKPKQLLWVIVKPRFTKT
jgi:uncharacterized protein GlcG (DUF336 family)